MKKIPRKRTSTRGVIAVVAASIGLEVSRVWKWSRWRGKRESAEVKNRRGVLFWCYGKEMSNYSFTLSLSGSELKRRHCRIYGNNINIIICRFNFHITFGFFRVFVFCFSLLGSRFAFSSPSQAQRNSGCQVMEIGDVLSWPVPSFWSQFKGFIFL